MLTIKQKIDNKNTIRSFWNDCGQSERSFGEKKTRKNNDFVCY
jgi:hypothetical protein